MSNGSAINLEIIKTNIKTHPDNCAQCLSCALICSFTHVKSFNVSKAFIRIIPGRYEKHTWLPTEIKFLEGCKPSCWLCSQECAYDALEHIGGNP